MFGKTMILEDIILANKIVNGLVGYITFVTLFYTLQQTTGFSLLDLTQVYFYMIALACILFMSIAYTVARTIDIIVERVQSEGAPKFFDESDDNVVKGAVKIKEI